MKKILIGIVVVIAVTLVIFFYPKDAGGICGWCPSTGIHRTEYDCIGFKYEYKPQCPDCGIEIKCMGIVTGQKKYYGVPEGSETTEEVEVPCK
jgi:hypothetical protein